MIYVAGSQPSMYFLFFLFSSVTFDILQSEMRSEVEGSGLLQNLNHLRFIGG